MAYFQTKPLHSPTLSPWRPCPDNLKFKTTKNTVMLSMTARTLRRYSIILKEFRTKNEFLQSVKKQWKEE
jgi:hypothetical protein